MYHFLVEFIYSIEPYLTESETNTERTQSGPSGNPAWTQSERGKRTHSMKGCLLWKRRHVKIAIKNLNTWGQTLYTKTLKKEEVCCT
jgi:hypothetical protein